MKFRKLISLFMAFAMVLSLLAMAGCGDKKPASTGDDDSAVSEEDFFADMPNELRGTKVQFATWIDHNGIDATATVLRGFEKETGMKSEIVAVPQGSYIPKLNSLIAADEAPDVVVDNGEFPNTLRLLSPLSWEENAIDPKDPFWNQEITELFTVGKYPYLVNAKNSTFNMGGYFVLYNRTKMEENGIKTPKQLMEEDNWNLDSLVVTLRQMKQRYMQNSAAAHINIHALLDMMDAAEISMNRETGALENGLKKPEALAALQWGIKYQEEGLVNLFLEGGAFNGEGIAIGGGYALRAKPGWFYDLNWDDLDMVPCPKVNKDDAEYPKTSSNRAYGVCKGSKNPKGAGYFLRYFLNGDNYDLNEVYKNEACVQMWKDLCGKYSDYKNAEFQYGCRKIVDPEAGSVTSGMMASLIKTSYAQIGTELSKTQNTVDAAVNKGNEIINEVKNSQ